MTNLKQLIRFKCHTLDVSLVCLSFRSMLTLVTFFHELWENVKIAHTCGKYSNCVSINHVRFIHAGCDRFRPSHWFRGWSWKTKSCGVYKPLINCSTCGSFHACLHPYLHFRAEKHQVERDLSCKIHKFWLGQLHAGEPFPNSSSATPIECSSGYCAWSG